MLHRCGILCRCRVEQLLADQTFLEVQQSSCASCKDTVGVFFWSTLASIVTSHLPEGHACIAPASPVATKRPDPANVPLDAAGQFLKCLSTTIGQLKDALVPVEVKNPGAAHEGAPHRSKHEMAKLADGKQAQLLEALGELLGITSGARKEELPLSQEAIIEEAASLDVVPHLIRCLEITQTAETRVRAAGLCCFFWGDHLGTVTTFTLYGMANAV